jgi:acetolactate synthase regulatory subunit
VSHPYRLELTLSDAPAVLDRVVATCRSRRCEIMNLHYEAGDRHRPGCLSLTVEGDPRSIELAERRLARLVDVVALRAEGAGLRAVASPEP